MSGMKLHEIPKELEKLVDGETGELAEYEKFMELQMELDSRLQWFLKMYKNEIALSEAIKAEVRSLQDRKASAEKRAERLKQYLSYALGGKPYKSAAGEVRYRKTTSVELSGAFMEWARGKGRQYLRFKDPEPDKKVIAEALKGGEDIPGAALEERQSVQIV